MTQQQIGNTIREKREEKKITQKSLIEKLGISKRAAFRIENGENVTVRNLLSYCELIGIEINFK